MTDNRLEPYGYVVEYGLAGRSFFFGKSAEMYCELKCEEVAAAGHENIKVVPVYACCDALDDLLSKLVESLFYRGVSVTGEDKPGFFNKEEYNFLTALERNAGP